MNADDSESSESSDENGEDDVRRVVSFANVLAIDEQLEATVRNEKRGAKRKYRSDKRNSAPDVDQLVFKKYQKIKHHVNKSFIQLSCCTNGCLVDAIDMNEHVDWNLGDPQIVDEDKQYPSFLVILPACASSLIPSCITPILSKVRRLNLD